MPEKALPPNPEILTVEQIAVLLQVTQQTVRNWVKSGALPAIKTKHLYRIRREDLDAMLARDQGSSGPLGTHRDPWAPETLGSPVRRRDSGRAPSVWDGTSVNIVPPKRQD